MLSFLKVPMSRQRLTLILVDLAIFWLALPVAVLTRGQGLPINLPPFSIGAIPSILIVFLRHYTGATTITMVAFFTVFYILDLYNPGSRRFRWRDPVTIVIASALATLAVAMVFYLIPNWKVGRGILIIQGALIVIGSSLWRLLYSRIHHQISRPKKVLVVGTGRLAKFLLDELHENFSSEFEVVGLIEDDAPDLRPELNGHRVIGGTRDVGRVARESDIEIIVFATPAREEHINADLMRDILDLKTKGIEIYQMPTFFKNIAGRVPVEFIEDSWLVFSQGFAARGSVPAERARRILDLVIAAMCLLTLSPLILLIAMAIRLTSRGPVLYRQERVGLNGRPYEMIKFRSMVTEAETDGPVWSTGKADTRVTRVGRFLRRTRLDEIPNFINVLRGEMSLVGPRPERAHFVQQLEREIPYYGLRFTVKPGMTGWAQVNYSYGASSEDAHRKLQYELYYIQERSLLLDMLIIFKTAQTVLMRPGS